MFLLREHEDGGSEVVRNVAILHRYMTSQPRRPPEWKLCSSFFTRARFISETTDRNSI